MDDRKRRRERRKAIALQRASAVRAEAGINVARKATSVAPVRSVTKMEPARPVVSVIADVIKPLRLPAAAMPRSITSKIKPSRTISLSAARLTRAPVSPRPSLPSPSPRPAPAVPKAGRVTLSALKQFFSSRTLDASARRLPASTPARNTPSAPLARLPSSPLQPSPMAKASDAPRKDRLTTCKERPKSNRRSGGSASGKSFVPWCG